MTSGVRDRHRSGSLWYLVYIAFLIPALIWTPSPLTWAVTAAALIVFVPFYVVAHLRRGGFGHWPPALMTLLGVLVIPVNTGATIFVIYAAAFAGSNLARPVAMRWLAGLTVLTGVLFVFSPVPDPYRIVTFVIPLVFVWVIGTVCMDDADREREGDALRVDNARIEHLATLTERERISRDLHDLLGQTLTGIVVRSQLAQRLARVDAEAGIAEMAQVEQAARAALGEVRATVSGWRNVDLDDELRVAADALAAAEVTLTVAREPGLVLTPTVETTLGLALREAVTNVVRHAHARTCTVALHRVDGQVRLEVTDDGVGGGGVDGTGLTGMRERIAALGGHVRRRTDGGTSLAVDVPVMVAT